MTRVSQGLDRIEVIFDEPNLVANAGLLLVATLSQRLGLEALIDSTVRLVGRVGGARPGRKVLTLVHAMFAGGSHIDHADMLRAGSTAAVLGHRVMAPSTMGTFLRAFTFGHVRQIEAVIGHSPRTGMGGGRRPGDAPLVIDIDSTICEVAGNAKQGAGFGYTKVLGYHPILATRADTGEVLHARMRKGQANTQRGARRFIDELVARVRRAGATGPLTVRVDSGFWSNDTIATLNRLERALHDGRALRRHKPSLRRSPRSPRPPGSTSTTPPAGRRRSPTRTYTTGSGTPTGDAPAGRAPHPAHRHAPSNDCGPTGGTTRSSPTSTATPSSVDAFHRHHAVVELAIRDLKEGAGLDHVPSGNFHANSAWLQCAVLAHNLIRWTAILGDVRVDDELTVARTIRTRLLDLPGRLVNRSGTRHCGCRPAGHGGPRSTPRSTTSAPSTSHPDSQPTADRRAAHPTKRRHPQIRRGTHLATPRHTPLCRHRHQSGTPTPPPTPFPARYGDRPNAIGGSRLSLDPPIRWGEAARVSTRKAS